MKEILSTHIQEAEKVDQITDALNDDYPTHSYPLLPEDLEQRGAPIRTLTGEQNKIASDNRK